MSRRHPNEYQLTEDGRVELFATRKGTLHSIFIDFEDFEEVRKHRWFVVQTSLKYRTLYACTCDHPRKYLHRFLLRPGGLEVDHEDHDGLNCVRSNMRLATGSQNQSNRIGKPARKSPYRGVFKLGEERFRAHISVLGQKVYIGIFKTALEAAYAYDATVRNYHGAFAITNFGS